MIEDKSIIGLIPLYDDEKESCWMLPGYMKALEAQGAVPVMLPLTDDHAVLDFLLERCDGFLLTGGHDVDPALYGAAVSPMCGTPCPLRDRMESYLLTRAVERNRPVLGICRGLQLMNVIYGGTLYQNLPTEHPSSIEHHMNPPYDRFVHAVDLIPDTPLFRTLETDACPVNSYHHQAIKALSPSFLCMAAAPDGVVEAIYMPDRRFVWGVQWHPEFSYLVSGESRKIFAAFLAAAKEGGHDTIHAGTAEQRQSLHQ